MFKARAGFSGFSVDNLEKASRFYSKVLGLKVDSRGSMGITIRLPRGGTVFVYPKGNHKPATYTVLNLEVADIDRAVDELKAKGVKFEQYKGRIQTDRKGIARGRSRKMGPDIAWFKDPAGNILSVLK